MLVILLKIRRMPVAGCMDEPFAPAEVLILSTRETKEFFSSLLISFSYRDTSHAKMT